MSWTWVQSLVDALPSGGPAVVGLFGPPAAGKSTEVERLLADLADPPVVLSLDRCRAWCSPFLDESDQRATQAAVTMLFGLLDDHLARGARVVVDSTGGTATARERLLRAAEGRGALTVAAVLLPPIEVVLARNATRDATPTCSGYARQVSAQWLERCHAAITSDLPHLHAEGWARVTRIDHRAVSRSGAMK